ncbi:MAG: 30S ribosomal protein S15 [Alphaproteobacteria bacterium]|nr:30S ribosomal protein S15 [Alphaproteobacteria bacterium]
MLTTTAKKMAQSKVQIHSTDTGSSAVQVALLTAEILELNSHLNTHKKDKHSRKGLNQKIENRRKHLSYLKKTNKPLYEKVLKECDLRK